MPRKTQKKTQKKTQPEPRISTPQAVVPRTPVSPEVCYVLNSAFFDSSVDIGHLKRSTYYIRVWYPDTFSYFCRFLAEERDEMLLEKTLMVKDRLAFAALASEKGFTKLEHIVGRLVWSFIGPDTMYPQIPAQRPTKRARV